MPTTAPAPANEYKSLIIAYRNGAAVRLQDVAEPRYQENIRHLASPTAALAVLVLNTKQPGANVIETVDRIRRDAGASGCRRPPSRSAAAYTESRIRNAVHDVESPLIISTVLAGSQWCSCSLRNFTATLVPTTVLPG
ncbi:MAG: efflux RND transporter permease subunit [Alphaproteobacteria bacterium]|nr:efflux RND transporter permease subunit [Alphaproteobacteria bacterium]